MSREFLFFFKGQRGFENGDVYPVTVMGKVLSGIISILGIILIALPSGIITSGFVKEYEEDAAKRRIDIDKQKICPIGFPGPL